MSANTTSATQPACSATPKLPNPIPVEILSRIISQLSSPELGRSARASRLFYLIATPLLYRTVHIDISLPINPLLIDGVPIPNHSWGIIKPTSFTQPPNEASCSLSPSSSLESAPPPSIPIHDRFLYTTHLTLRAHRRDQCSVLLPGLLAMPRLQSLRVLPNAEDHRLDLCTSVDELPGPLDPEHCCPLMRGLRPRKVTLGDMTTGLSGSARGMHTKLPPRSQFDPTFPILTSSFPPPHVKELVILVGVPIRPGHHVCATHDLSTALFLRELPASLTKVTFILSPLLAGRSNVSPPGWMSQNHLTSVIMINLAEACSGDAQVVELVGYDALGKCRLGGGLWNGKGLPIVSFRDLMRDEIVWCLKARGLAIPDAKDRAKKVKFVGGEEWRARLDGDVGAEAELLED